MSIGDIIPSVSLNAKQVGQQNCFDAWREEVRPFYDVEPLSSTSDGKEKVNAWLLDQLIFSEVEFSHQSFSHRATHIENANYLSLQIYQRGSTRGVFANTPLEMAPGEVHLFDFSREFHSLAEASVVSGVVVSHEAIGYDPARHPAHMCFPSNTPVGRFLTKTFFALFEQLPSLQKDEGRAMAEGFCGLLNGLLTPRSSSEVDSRRLRAERRVEMHSYIDRHLGDMDLGVEHLVGVFGASRASIYRDFAEAGGVARFITNRRLDRIFHQLLSASPARGLVQEVARRWGFDDTGHFSRLFRQRFGTPPSVVLSISEGTRMHNAGIPPNDALGARKANLGLWLKGL